MAKTKTLTISGPMNAKHVGGVNVTGSNGPNVDNYFANTSLQPDELPSHTFVASGTTEVPRRADTIASVIRRPSISIKRSLSKLRTKSISHFPQVHRDNDGDEQFDMPIARTDSTKAPRPLKMQSSMSRLRQKVGLDRDLHEPIPVPKAKTPEPETAPEPVQKDYPPLKMRKSIARLTTASSIYTISPDAENSRTSTALQRQSSTLQRQPSSAQRRASPTPQRLPSNAKNPVPTRPVRPKRADSGTAIDFNDVPVQERPIPFKDILAVQSFADRMAMYKKTRDYWANADHGLLEWTGRAAGAKLVVVEV